MSADEARKEDKTVKKLRYPTKEEKKRGVELIFDSIMGSGLLLFFKFVIETNLPVNDPPNDMAAWYAPLYKFVDFIFIPLIALAVIAIVVGFFTYFQMKKIDDPDSSAGRKDSAE